MSPLGWTLVQFALCAALILLAGVRLARYGDIIAEKTGLGGTWLGVLALASVTSLPELITGASSVVIFDLPNIAAGDVIGSCMFNLVILAFLDVRDPRPLSIRAHQGHVLSAGFGLVLLGLAALALTATTRSPIIGLTYRAAHKRFRLSWDTFAIVAVYLIGVTLLRGLE